MLPREKINTSRQLLFFKHWARLMSSFTRWPLYHTHSLSISLLIDIVPENIRIKLTLKVMTCSFLTKFLRDLRTAGEQSSKYCQKAMQRPWPRVTEKVRRLCCSSSPCLLDVYPWKCMGVERYLPCHSCTCINTRKPLTKGVINYTSKEFTEKTSLQQPANETDQLKYFSPSPRFHSGLFTLLSEIKQLCLHS